MLSKPAKEDYDAIMERVVDEYMAREFKNATSVNAENLSFVFTYRATQNLVRLTKNLVKQSSILSWLTVALLVTSIGMISLAVWQLLVMLSR